MNVSPTIPARSTTTQTDRWLLEVVRGRDVGRIFPIEPGETVVGNALSGQRGLDLLDQEGNTPRRMAVRHAALICSGQELSLRDLESPGGTFVNQQRLLSGQPRKLSPGDVIQLGSVQLKVKHEHPATEPAVTSPPPSAALTASPEPATVDPRAVPAARAQQKAKPSAPPAAAPAGRMPEQTKQPAPAAGGVAARPPGQSAAADRRSPVPASTAPAAAGAASPGRLPLAFAMAGGAVSHVGRLSRTRGPAVVLPSRRADVRQTGRVSPEDSASRAGALHHARPTGRRSARRMAGPAAGVPEDAPELDVHPESLLIQAKTGGTIAGPSLRVTNVGYRLLRWTARVEPTEASWIRLAPEHAGRPVQTIDQTELPVHLELPETIDRPLRAMIIFESNGGTRRIEVLIERPAQEVVIPEGEFGIVAGNSAWGGRLRQTIARLPLFARLAAGCVGAVALRFLILLMNVVPIGGRTTGSLEPRLVSVSVVLVVVGVLVGWRSCGPAARRAMFPQPPSPAARWVY